MDRMRPVGPWELGSGPFGPDRKLDGPRLLV